MIDRSQSGFSLVEVLMALFLIGIGVLAAAPMFMYAMQGNAVGEDFGSAGALGVERMELLRAQGYASLAAGGNLDGNVNGYFDASDDDYLVRWTVAINGVPVGSKTISVRVIANRQVVGRAKQVDLVTVRGR